MVRFQWHVEDGHCAFVPVNGSVINPDGIQHAMVEMEVPGVAGSATSMLSMPACAHKPGTTKCVGVVLAHDHNSAEWQGKLMTGLAQALALEGFLVMRNFCALKEARRQRLFEKALDAAATCPYSAQVTSWVLAGVGNGARVAAAVGTRCRGQLAGFMLLSYPLMEPMPASKGPGMPDSKQPVLKAKAPVLFIHTQNNPLCSVADLQACCAGIQDNDARIVVVPGVNPEFKTGGPAVPARIVRKIATAALMFLRALNDGTLAECSLPRHNAPALDCPEPEGDVPGVLEDDEQDARAEQAALLSSSNGASNNGMEEMLPKDAAWVRAGLPPPLPARVRPPLPPLPDAMQFPSVPLMGAMNMQGVTRPMPAFPPQAPHLGLMAALQTQQQASMPPFAYTQQPQQQLPLQQHPHMPAGHFPQGPPFPAGVMQHPGFAGGPPGGALTAQQLMLLQLSQQQQHMAPQHPGQ